MHWLPLPQQCESAWTLQHEPALFPLLQVQLPPGRQLLQQPLRE